MTSDINKLYREGNVPEDLKGRGIWERFANEILFSPFNGPGRLIYPTDWKCEYCKGKWYINKVIENEYHCPWCGQWAGLLEVK